jgi:hypothetical protein
MKPPYCRGCKSRGMFELTDEPTERGEPVWMCECGHEEVELQ